MYPPEALNACHQEMGQSASQQHYQVDKMAAMFTAMRLDHKEAEATCHVENEPEELAELMDIDEPVPNIGWEETSILDVVAFEPMNLDEESHLIHSGEATHTFAGRASPLLAEGSNCNLYHQLRPKRSSSRAADSRRRRQRSAYCSGKPQSSAREPLGIVPRNTPARVSILTNRLTGPDPVKVFGENCEKNLADWISLLRQTTLPKGIPSVDPRVRAAFRMVDNVIYGKARPLLRRLAYVRLTQIFACLEAIIKAERGNGTRRALFYRDASVAMNIYRSAQQPKPGVGKARRENILKERKRTAGRWSDLAASSPLCVLIYTEAAESFV